MKKMLIVVIGFILLLSGCSNIHTDSISNQNLSEEVFENIIEKHNLSSDDYIEYDGNLAVALSDKIIVKFDSECKEIYFKKPSNLSSDKNFLYFINESKNEIYSVDYNSFEVKSIFSTDDIITFYWAVGNGNLFIETSTKNTQNTLDIASEFILNPQANKCYEKEDSIAYQGVSCIAINLQNEVGESVTRLFYDDSYRDFDYISNPCRIGNFIYYTKNPETINENKQIDTVYVYSIKDKKESVFLEREINNKNGLWDSIIKDIFAYNDYIYLKIGINQSNSSDYEKLEFYKLNPNGELINVYKINRAINSASLKFFNNKIYYNDLNGGLNEIDLAT